MNILEKMKKVIFSVLTLLLAMNIAFAQGKKPTLMILPSDNWCSQRYFMTNFDNQGTTVKIPDYKAAFQDDAELSTVISIVGGLLAECGYPVKDSEQELKNLDVKQGEDNAMMSKTSGASLAESPLDVLKRKSKSDMIIQIGWSVNKEAAGKSVTFQLDAIDSYTSKRIASATGTGESADDIVPRLLETAVKTHIPEFTQKLDNYFYELGIKGREIVLTVKKWDSWENDLETEYDGEELTDCIVEWLNQNTVGGNYNLSDATENYMLLEQVRIPIKDERGMALDARGFANQLRKYLQKEPFNITSKVITRGLGEAMIVLGEK